MTTTTDHPDWSTITQRIACPLCDYELRGLIDPRCPECGYQFTWHAVLHAQEYRHPYLFEHHPEKNIRSFLRTKFAALLPWKFWRGLQPTHEIVRGRLLIYWLLSAPLIALILPAGFVPAFLERVANANRYAQQVYRYRGYRTPPSPWTAKFIGQSWRDYWGGTYSQWRPISLSLIFLAWPWALLATLMIFQSSLRRAKIKPIHVRRCVIYSCDNAIIAGVLLLCFAPLTDSLSRTRSMFGVDFECAQIGTMIIALITGVKLGFALERYLQFPRPWLTTLLAEFVVMLAAITVVMTLLWN